MCFWNAPLILQCWHHPAWILKCAKWFAMPLYSHGFLVTWCKFYSFLFGPKRHEYAFKCTSPISINATFCDRNVHVCTFMSQNGDIWDISVMYCGISEMGPRTRFNSIFGIMYRKNDGHRTASNQTLKKNACYHTFESVVKAFSSR